MGRDGWLREKRREVERLRGIATNSIVPSRRDFSQFLASQRTDLALVPRLKRSDPQTGGTWGEVALTELARAFDDTDVAAIAVSTAAVHGMSSDDLVVLRGAVSAPLLRDDLCLDECQVYDSRLRGADAVRIPIRDLDDEQISKLCDVAISLHVTPVLEVANERDLERAPARPPHCVGLDCVADDGFVDVAQISNLAPLVPAHVVVVVLAEPRSLEEGSRMRGLVDGVVVGDVLLGSHRPVEEVARFLRW